MGLNKKQQAICKPFMDYIGPYNEEMIINATRLASEKGLILNTNILGTFSAIFGKDYDFSGNHGLLFYGRSNNGWDEDAEDFEMQTIGEQTQRPFFNLIRRLSEIYFEDWYNHIAWSNIYKLVPCGSCDEAALEDKWIFQNTFNGNPSNTLRRIQEKSASRIIKAEQDFFNPFVSVLVTGYNCNDTWDEPIWGYDYNNFKQIGEDIIWHEDEKGQYMAGLHISNDRFFIQTDRPERRPIQPHVNAIVELIEKAKDYKKKL